MHGRRKTKDSGVSKWHGTADVSAAGHNIDPAVQMWPLQERLLRCRPIRPRLTAGLGSPVTGIPVWLAIAFPRLAARLRFDRCATVPETQPLPAAWRAHPPATSTDCPAASDRGPTIPWPAVRGPIGHCASPVALPL